MCNPAVTPSYEKTLATINNEAILSSASRCKKKKKIKTKNHLARAHNRYTEFKTWQKECKWLQEGL